MSLQRKVDMKNLGRQLAFVALLLSLTGCGVLLGNVKPVEEKSDDYGVLDLSRESKDWVRLEKETGERGENNGSGLSDVAYQSKTNATIISLNSVCRPRPENPDRKEQPLKDLTGQLLMGISDITFRDEQELILQGVPALQTTIEGKENGSRVMLRTIVLRKEDCVYDLMYIARPETFATHEPTFTHFVASLRLK